MTGYIIHYNNTGSSDSTGTGASSTSTDITGLTAGETYTISVEARSKHLSGESGKMTIILGKSHFIIISACISCVFIEAPNHSRRCGGCCRVCLSHSVLGGSG